MQITQEFTFDISRGRKSSPLTVTGSVTKLNILAEANSINAVEFTVEFEDHWVAKDKDVAGTTIFQVPPTTATDGETWVRISNLTKFYFSLTEKCVEFKAYLNSFHPSYEAAAAAEMQAKLERSH